MKIKVLLAVVCIFVCCWPSAVRAQDSANHGLTIEDVVSLVRHGIPAEQVIKLIQENPSNFDLSLSKIDNLASAGIPVSVVDAMLKSRGDSQDSKSSPQHPEPKPSTDIPPSNIHPSPVTGASLGPTTLQPSNPTADNGGASAQMSADSAARLQQAKSAKIPPDGWASPTNQVDLGCPLSTRKWVKKVDLDYDTGSSSAARLGRSGMYCFALRNANPLYDWLLTLSVSEVTGSPFDLLNDAIQTLTKLSTGASSAKPTPLPGKELTKGACPDLSDMTQKATALKQALAKIVPAKDSSGKTAYVSIQKTQADWQAVPGAFSEFEKSVQALVTALPTNSDPSCDSVLQEAETTILDDYPKLRAQFEDLANRLTKPSVIYYEQQLEATTNADLVATPSYAGTSSGSKTFHFDPSFGILSSSAGFLLTELPATSYSSATAPSPSDPTKTQNVLKVDYGPGVRPALTVLLTGNLPQLNSRNFGLGLSAGPVFDISNGKADTSHFGFFGGVSLRLTPWIFLTPGVHVGEFADFPQGFNQSGQLIPPNTGTPIPTKRYTARFAFSVTFKLKDLGAPIGGSQAKPQTAAPAQPASGVKQ